MYEPEAFKETDERVLHDFIRAHPLATFVNVERGGLCANHFPMLIENGDDGKPVLKTVGEVFKDHGDAYSAECKM